jgi:hypothetical protein
MGENINIFSHYIKSEDHNLLEILYRKVNHQDPIKPSECSEPPDYSKPRST